MASAGNGRFQGKRSCVDSLAELNAFSFEFLEAAEAAFDWTGRNTHWFNRLFMVMAAGSLKSELICHSTGQRLTMRPGWAYFVAAAADMEFHFRASTRFVSFHFFRNDPDFGPLPVTAARGVRELKCDAADHALISSVIGDGPEAVRICAARAVLYRAVTQIMVREPVPESVIPGKYAALLRHLGTAADGRTTVAELAERFGFSRDRLSRDFSRTCGTTLKRHIVLAVVARAERLLRLEPGLRLREVARRLNFSDEYYFSRFFKKHTGRTPGEYRREGSLFSLRGAGHSD